MLKYFLIIISFNFCLFSQSLKEILDKKISLPYGILHLESIGKRLEEQLGFPVKVVTEKKHTFIFKNYKDKSISHLLALLMVSHNLQVSFILEDDQLKLQLYIPYEDLKLNDSEKEEINNKKVGLGFDNVKLKEISDMIEYFFGKKIIFLNKEKEDEEISCELNYVTLEQFLNFLKEKYQIDYELKENFVFIK